MSAFSISNFFTCFTTFLLALFVYFSNNKLRINKIFFLYSLSISWWSFFTAYHAFTSSEELSLLSARLMHITVPLIPVLFYHFCLIIIDLYDRHKYTLYVGYAFSIIIIVINAFTSLIVANVRSQFGYSYFMDGGILYPILVLLFSFYSISGLYLLFMECHKSVGNRKNQFRYLFGGSLLGYSLGVSNFFPVYDITIYPYPFGSYAISIYVLMTTYAIVKYRLMDIKLAITRAGIFICVYTLVLGIPFGVGLKFLGTGLWLMPVSLMAVFATIGPFIYLFMQRKAEAQLLIEQHQYQTTLRQASLGIGQIKELGRLLKLIVHIVTRTVAIEHCEIYLFHEDSKQFTLKASRGWSLKDQEQISVIASDSPLVQYLKEIKDSIVYEEIEQFAQDNDLIKYKNIERIIKKLDGSLIVPSFIDQKIIAILVLGKKKSGKIFTQDDLAVFSILANQAGLGIENAQFYETMKETHKQLLAAEKMATVGTMADGLSHQLNNRLHAMGFIAGDALDTLKLKKKEKLSPDMKQLFEEIEHSLVRIEDNVKRGGEIVEGLLKYTSKGSEGFEAIQLNKLLDAALEMAQYKIKLNQMNISRNFEDSTTKIKGNFTQLQEVFFNIIDNAYDAMMQRKNDLKEAGYKADLSISAGQSNGKIEILIQDNGIGVKKEDLDKLFTPFFTTKLSSKKGTGLGLYVIRQIIEENHHGKVEFTSEYQKGSQTRLLLPAAV